MDTPNTPNKDTPNNQDSSTNKPAASKSIFQLFRENTERLARGLYHAVNNNQLAQGLRSQIKSSRNKEVRESVENNLWEVNPIERSDLDKGNNKIANEILELLSAEVVDVPKLREIAKQGVPPILRSSVWKLLLGLLPPERAQWDTQRQRLVEEYKQLLLLHYLRDTESDGSHEESERLFHQVHIDCHRTSIPGYQHIFENEGINEVLNRVLYLWSKAHPEISYFQGLNEIAAPFIFFYLFDYVDINSAEDFLVLGEKELANLEIDAFFSLRRVMEWVSSIYDSTEGSVYAGLMVEHIAAIVKNHTPDLDEHFSQLKIDYNIVCFRWALCLLTREMNILNLGRLFDYYLSLGDEFPKLHPYVCAALFHKFSDKILPLEFNETILVMQRLIPATFSQSGDHDLITPLVIKAKKMQNADIKNGVTFRYSKKEGAMVQKKSQELGDGKAEVPQELQKEEDSTGLFVGAVLFSLFASAVALHYGRRMLNKK